MNRGKLRAALHAVCAALLSLAATFSLFLPLPRTVSGGAERYACAWENGTRTEEPLSALLPYLAGVSEEGDALVLRGGISAAVPSEALKRAHAALVSGDAAALYALDAKEMAPLFRVAFTMEARGTVLYDGTFYGWAGTRFRPVMSGACERFVWVSGNLSAGTFASLGAKEAHICTAARLNAASFLGSAVERVTAEAPYAAEGDVVCLDTAGGRRIVAALPVSDLFVCDADFADAGALCACRSLVRADVPFVGSARSGKGTMFDDLFAHWFLQNGDYDVPQTLRAVRVRGGVLAAHAFYRCRMIEEIDACGVAPEQIEAEAFVDCTSLRILHTPRADVTLRGTFTARALPCGCTLYERAE